MRGLAGAGGVRFSSPIPRGEVRGLAGGGLQAQAGGVVSQHAVRQTPLPPKQTATAADGTHHTGMHSCYKSFLFMWRRTCIVAQEFGCN